MSGAVFTLGNSVSGSLSLGSALSKFGRVAGQAGFTIEQEEETLNNTVTSRYAGLAAVTVSGVTSVLNPSLVLIPSAYNTSGSTGILYSLHSKPNGVADFVVTRATEGTRFNSVGKISTVGSGDARLDYLTSGGTVGPPALLVEPSAQNLALQSQDFTTTWSPTNVTVSANVTGTTDPFGTNLADLLTATASGSARVVQTFGFVSGTTYTYSCFAKAGNGFFGMTMENGGVGSGVAVIWNVSTGAFSVSGSVGSGYTLQAHNIENYGNGWYRCSMRVLLGLTVTGNIRVNTSNGTMSSVVIQSDNGNSVNVFGAQVEAGTVGTSYIPTTAAPVTRNADVISVSGAVSGCIGQTEGTIYAEVVNTLVASYAEAYVYRVFADANNEIWARKEGGGNTYSFRWRANSQNTTFLNVAVPNGVNKIAFGYKSGDTALFLNGSQVATTNTDVRAFSVNPTTIALGSTSSGQFFNDRIRAVALYTTRLTNDELDTLTTL
jgi:hypothetical protein